MSPVYLVLLRSNQSKVMEREGSTDLDLLCQDFALETLYGRSFAIDGDLEDHDEKSLFKNDCSTALYT